MLWLWIVLGLVGLMVAFAIFSLIKPGLHDRWLERLQDAGSFSRQSAIESNLGRNERALRFAEKAIAIEPEEKVHWYNKGVALAGLDQWAEALKAFDQAIALDQNFWQAWHNKAAMLERQGRHAESDLCTSKAEVLKGG